MILQGGYWSASLLWIIFIVQRYPEALWHDVNVRMPLCSAIKKKKYSQHKGFYSVIMEP